MLVSGIGVVVVVVYVAYRCVDIVDSGLCGEHGWGSRGDRVLFGRERVFRARRGSRRRLASERGGG
jgi:hypothetical protein